MVDHEVCPNMAQTTVPVYLTAKLGSLACTKYRQGTAIRTKLKPKNPKTAAQTTQRQRFTPATKAGAGLTAAAQPSWSTFAKTPKHMDVLWRLAAYLAAWCFRISFRISATALYLFRLNTTKV